ncbi:alpha/beta fold hydrolase [Plantactinospora sp. WMMC1484]|uniref:alpha/beta fold hydrolase n=1 Tax=Plantactinospora sp. WMMC1484 TaxID=3404122 RepID=UPI003BF5E280
MHDAVRQHLGGLVAESYGTADDRPPLVLLHGLTYDRRQWEPLLRELAIIDPGRQVLALDLPGHGESARRDSYYVHDVVRLLHEAVVEAGLDTPVMVGHSLGGMLATAYAGIHPARAVVNLDQPLLVGDFAQVLRQVEPVLRSSEHGQVWASMLARMEIHQLPPAARELVRTATTPRQDLLLGYWDEVLRVPLEELGEQRSRELTKIRSERISYRYVTQREPDPAYRRWLESVLPEITITVLPGTGHFPHLVQPAEVAGILATEGRER